jgi:hypothetical protein
MKSAAAIAIVLALSAPTAAHPTSSLEFALAIDGDRFDVTITCEEAILRAKVEALQRPLAELVDVRFDGVRVLPVARGFTPGAPNESPVMHLVGTIPDRASSVTFSTALVYGSFPLTIVRPGHPPGIEWLQGAQVSAAYDMRERGAGRRVLWPFVVVVGVATAAALGSRAGYTRRFAAAS